MNIKYKTNKSFYKRFKITSKGKIKFKHSNLRHNLTNQPRNKKNFLKKKIFIEKNINKQLIKQHLPYL